MRHPAKAIAIGVLSLIFMAIIPFLFVATLSGFIAQSGGDPSKYFHNTGMYVLVLGTLFSIFAALGAYYEKGSGKRLAFTIISAILLALWGYLFIGSMSIYYEGDTYAYEVLVPGIALVLMLFLSIRVIYRVVEYLVYRDEYSSMEAEEGPETYVSEEESAEEEEMYF